MTVPRLAQEVPLARLRRVTAQWIAFSGTASYQRILDIWCGLFCAGLFGLPAGWQQAVLFYAGVPLSLPAVLAVAQPMLASPMARVLGVFLAYSALSCLWSDRWLTVGDQTRRALCIWYFLAVCCAIGQDGAERWHRLLRGLQIFAAAAAIMLVVDYRWHCGNCERLVGFGGRANANYTAHAAGVVALLGLTSLRSAAWRATLTVFACQVPIVLLLVLTGSRAALLGYLSAVTLCVILTMLRSRTIRVATVVLPASVAGLALAGGIALQGQAWLAAAIERGDTHRLQIWATNLARIAERPWFGHGGTSADTFVIDGVVLGYHAHNLFLAQAFYGGIVGMLLWLSVFVLAALAAVRTWRRDGDVLPAVCLWFLFAVGMIDIGPVVVEFQAIWLYVWVILGIVLSYDLRQRRGPRAEGIDADKSRALGTDPFGRGLPRLHRVDARRIQRSIAPP
jgi:O-antigen ligase